MGSTGDVAAGVLRRRIERLDEHLRPIMPIDADPRVLHFIIVMQTYTDTMMHSECGGRAVIGAKDADEIVACCDLLGEIGLEEPALGTGAVMPRQHWIGTARHSFREGQAPKPTMERFADARQSSAEIYSTKPFGVGLYSSSARRRGRSMWRNYLDLFYGSDLYPLPWVTWELHCAKDGVPILDIASADDWVAFVMAYAKPCSELLYPDWRRVAEDFKGVHMTLGAIVATQGFYFETEQGLTAPAFWDVESTLWLRWSFDSAVLVEATR